MVENSILVSVCMITYNHERYLKTAINSIIAQNVNFNFELIIGADDPSKEVLGICKEFYNVENPKIVLLESKEPRGMIHNFFRTINSCSGKYIAICEGDDYWSDSDKLQKQVDFLEKHPEYGMVATDINLINDNGVAIPDNEMVIKQRASRKPEPTFFDLLQINTINTLTTCIRSELMKDLVRTAQQNDMWFVYDYWFWLNISLCNKIKLLYDKTATYRVHENGVSKKTGFFKVRKPLVIYYSLEKYFRSAKENNSKVLNTTVKKLLKNRNFPMSKKIKLTLQYFNFFLKTFNF